MANDPVNLMITIAKPYRDQLRVMAARENIENPNRVTSAAELARQIIINFLENTNGISK